MNNSFVEMGSYYQANPYGLVRTVCRATDSESGDQLIAYVTVAKGGVASEVFVMPENQFENIFI